VTKKGFIMNLTSYVSGLLNSHVREMLLLQQVNPENISHWAIHPGGKKILDDFRATLGLSREALVHSYAVLEKYGNMSSATILFVLQKLITGGGLKKKEKIYTAAFGPGLTIESAILEYV
jgi:predicted naringenin-chalcone synthase